MTHRRDTLLWVVLVVALFAALALLVPSTGNGNQPNSCLHGSPACHQTPLSTTTTINLATSQESGAGSHTPGMELIALVGALAIALVLVRRKL